MEKQQPKEAVTVMGKKLNRSLYPKLYKWAKDNPETLEATIKSMMEKQCFTNPGSAMAILESDLG